MTSLSFSGVLRAGMLAGCVLLASLAYGQSARLRAANKQFDALGYAEAARLYQDVLRSEPDAAEAREAKIRLAYCYRKLQDTRNAERLYGELVRSYRDLSAELYLYYAQALAANGNYRESQRMYSLYGQHQTADLRARRFAMSYMDPSRFYRDSATYRLLTVPFNSRQSDFSPMYYQSGLVFVSGRNESGAIRRVFGWDETPFLDLYYVPDTVAFRSRDAAAAASTARLGGGANVVEAADSLALRALTKAELFSRTLNTKYHEGPVTFTSDQRVIVFTRNNSSRGRSGKSSDGTRKLKLYSALNRDGRWTEITELPFNSAEFSTGHPAFSPDDSRLYFVSDRPGGYGGTDLYVVEYQNGQWGTPVNMGKEINTEGNEMFPFVDANGHLYFASDGHEGLGGLDVFYAELRGGIPYKGVENLGAPVNSPRDDFGFIADKYRTTGYFSSNRGRSGADDDIFRFERVCKELNIYVYDADTGKPLAGADVRVFRDEENTDLKATDTTGRVTLCIDAGADYEFKAFREGYAQNSVRFSTQIGAARANMNVAVYLNRADATLVRGIIQTGEGQQPTAGVAVTLRDERDQTERTMVTGPDGGYEFTIRAGTAYRLLARKENYAVKQTPAVKPKRSVRVLTDSLQLYGKGDIFELRNIYYDFGKFFIRPEAARELSKLVAVLKEYPAMRIELRSHTDARASEGYNLRLSQNRARAAMDYLVANGIDPVRLEARGYGESELLNSCTDGVRCSEAEHRQNRRTEFKILAVQ